MKKIVICAVPYSDNLGDGVIAESLTYIFGTKYPSAKIELLDIAGREDYVKGEVRGSRLFNAFQRMPDALQSLLVATYCHKQYHASWKQHWTHALADADLVVIGGGQLFCDVSLNFPMKLHLLSKAIRPGTRVGILCVGVAAKWSTCGRRLVLSCLRRLKPDFIAARDAASVKNMREIFDQGEGVRLIQDPAVLSADAFAQPLMPRSEIAMCVSALNALSHNSEYKAGQDGATDGVEYFQHLYLALKQRFGSVQVFTNGASEDNIVARALAQRLKIEDQLLIPNTPAELVKIIASTERVVAHRLHANIVAYSLGVPSIGLNWDKKVASFFAMTERNEMLLPMTADAQSIASAAISMERTPKNDARLSAMKQDVFDAIRGLI